MDNNLLKIDGLDDFYKTQFGELEKLGGKEVLVRLFNGTVWSGKLKWYNGMFIMLERQGEEMRVLMDDIVDVMYKGELNV